VNQRDELARRYRQRLALYPRAYRREHEEEMLAVRMRRLALAVITAVLGLWVLDARYGFRSLDTFDVLLLTCYGLEATALIASPGPRRGLQLMSWPSGAVLAGAAAALTVTWTLTMRLAYGDAFTSSGDAEVNGLAVLALVILAAGVFLFSHLGRYVVVLFAGMLCPYVLYLGCPRLVRNRRRCVPPEQAIPRAPGRHSRNQGNEAAVARAASALGRDPREQARTSAVRRSCGAAGQW
jgi:hypothetical protein